MVTTRVNPGDTVEIHVAAFKGENGRVIRVSENEEEVTVELIGTAIPIPITIRADQVRVTQRVDE